MASGEGMEGLTLRNGQSCFYFSHGCTIHCDKCDGRTARFGSTCGNEKTAKATICEPALRTLNRKAECGGPDDKSVIDHGGYACVRRVPAGALRRRDVCSFFYFVAVKPGTTSRRGVRLAARQCSTRAASPAALPGPSVPAAGRPVERRVPECAT